MREKKQFGKNKRLLCLLLAVVLMCGMIPAEPIRALGSESSQEIVGATEKNENTAASTEEIIEQENDKEPEDGSIEDNVSDSGEELSENTEPVTYTNSIGGRLWLDMLDDTGNGISAGNATYDDGEEIIPDYTVSLYKAEDTSNAVQTTITDEDGKYQFSNLEPGSYVVGVAATTIDGSEYLLPFCYPDGTEGDNRFAAAYDSEAGAYINAYTEKIVIEADSVIESMDAGMRTVPAPVLMATEFTIDINTVTAAMAPVGTSFSGNILTFNTEANNYTYTITGETTEKRIVVAGGVNTSITLDGVNISNVSVSPFQLASTANVNLILADTTTNSLTCLSTSTAHGIRSGIYVPSGATITVSGGDTGTGTLEAEGGYGSAGIGGGNLGEYNPSGTITIKSGTIIAKGGGKGGGDDAGAGIGGGANGHGGTITIYGDTVTATGGRSEQAGGAGIGGGAGGAGGVITIYGGTITATGGAATDEGGAGIGGGGKDAPGGTITIEDGTIIAKGGSAKETGAGIGGGGKEGAGGKITINGGIIEATGGRGEEAESSGAGIGAGGEGGSGTNIFTSGSIHPTKYNGAVSVKANPKNGPENGNDYVYMTTVTVLNADREIIPNALVYVELPTYTYTAYTNESGIAYIWIPQGAHTFEAEHDDHGYGYEDSTVSKNNKNEVEIVIGMKTTLSRAPETIAFITDSDPTPVTLHVRAENTASTESSDIIGAAWFRVATTSTTPYHASAFNDGYAAADSADKGSSMTEQPGGTRKLRKYSLPVNKNGKYWVKVHYKDGLGIDRYQVKSLVIDNVYTPSTGNYKGIDTSDGRTLYDEPIPNMIDAEGKPLVGVALELNSTTMLSSTVDGTTAVADPGAILTVSAKDLGRVWSVQPTEVQAYVNRINLPDFIFKYTLKNSAITVQFDPQGGTPEVLPNQYYMPSDTFDNLPSVSWSDSNFTFAGWYTEPTGGSKVENGSALPDTWTPGTTETLYAHWIARAKDLTISKTITGPYADMGKSFTFTVYFENSSGTPLASGTQFTFTGGIISGSGASAPEDGTLTLDTDGKDSSVTLKHGQTITIEDVPTTSKIRIVEAVDANYTTSFKDSKDSGSTNGFDTGIRPMTNDDRTFDFTNTRKTVVPGGISLGGSGRVLLAVTSFLAISAGVIIATAYSRRRHVGQ